MARTHPAVFIDRDGTLIHERHYLRRIGDLRLFAGAVPAMKLLRDAGFRLIMVTNQSGIGRGYLTEKKLLQIHAALNKMLADRGVSFDAVYYCPHHPDTVCACRKPKLGMVEKARKRFGIDLRRSYTIGDHAGDIRLAHNMRGTGVFVLTGHGREERPQLLKKGARPDMVARDILHAARLIARHAAARHATVSTRGGTT